MFRQLKPSSLSFSQDTVSGKNYFFPNNNPLFTSVQSANPNTIMAGTRIVTQPVRSTSSQSPHRFQISLPGTSTTTSSCIIPHQSTLPSSWTLFPSQRNCLRITKNVLPPRTKVLTDIQKKEARATRRIIGREVRAIVNAMEKRVQTAKEAGFPFKTYVNYHFRPKRNQKVHVSIYDPAPVVFYFLQLVQRDRYPNVSKTLLIRTTDWLRLGRNGWGHFGYVWLMTYPEEVLSAIAILASPDVLDEKGIWTSVNKHLTNANPVPLRLLPTLPKVPKVPNVPIQLPVT